MSVLSYNGVSFGCLLTKDVDYSDVMSDDGMDYLYTKITLSVQGFVFHAPGGGGDDKGPSIGGGSVLGVLGFRVAAGLGVGVGADPAGVFVAAQHMLEQPRCKLLYQVGATVVVSADATTDVRNGPFPKVVSINRVDGIEALLVDFQIVTYKNACPKAGGNATKPIVLSNRWREEESHDADLMARRTRTGKIVIRGGAGHPNPDDYRWMCAPPLADGFVRKRANYAVQEDGLAMTYSIEDHEVFRMPPFPACEWTGDYVETHEWPGAKRWGNVHITMKGQKDVAQSAMVSVGLTLAISRLKSSGIFTDPRTGGFMVGMTVRASMSKNEVDITMKAMLRNYNQPQPGARASGGGPTQSILKFFVGGGLGQAAAKEVVGRINGQVPGLGNGISLVDRGVGGGQTIDLRQFDGGTGANQWEFDQKTPFFSLRSLSGMAMAAAIVNDPCLDDAVLKGGGALNPGGNENILGGRIAGGVGNGIGLIGNAGIGGGVGTLANIVTVAIAPNISDDFEFVSGGPYTNYDVRLRVKTESHIREMPSTKEGVPTAFVQTANPTKRLLVEWTAERLGQPPQVPDSQLRGVSLPVLLEAEENPGTVEVASAGGLIYKNSGSYLYGFERPDLVEVTAAVVPWARDLAGSVSEMFLNSAASVSMDDVSNQMFAIDGTANLGAIINPIPNA